MAQYILFIREDLSKYPLPEEENNALVHAHMKWAAELNHSGIFKAGHSVSAEGRLIEMIDGEYIVQPLRDVHQGIGGYYIIEAADLAAAVEIAIQMPTYKEGDLVEVRPLGS